MPSFNSLTLPDDVLYSKLLATALQQGDRLIVDDRSRSIQFGYLDILNGTVALKQKLQQLLDPSLLEKRGDFFVALLAPNGYEFIVGVLATLALGGIIVPVREYSPLINQASITRIDNAKMTAVGALPAEAAYVIRHCEANILLVGPEQVELAAEIDAEISILSLAVPGPTSNPASLPPLKSYVLDNSLAVPDDTPSILFFTSGTTGPPKGVLHARRSINKYAHDSTTESPDEICVIPRGAFWSIYFTKLFQMLLLGVRIEIQNFGRNYDLIWENLRHKRTTKIVLSPTFWYGMMAHYNSQIANMEENLKMEYVDGFRYLRDACITGAMPSVRLKEFWRDLRGGRALKVLYGTTETQEIATVQEDDYSTEADLGTPLPNVTIKLSDGDKGEVLVKTPSLFLGYLHATEDSAQRFDSEGFFKTGDLAVRRNGRIIFEGRANMDLFKFYTYKVPRLHVENRLLALPYVKESYIMPVEDPQCDTRVAALVRVVGETNKVDLGRIRADLSEHLPAYQLPTVLRILKDNEIVPRTWSDKTAMRKAIHLFFPQDAEQHLVGADTEVMDISHFMKSRTQNMWDLSGMR